MLQPFVQKGRQNAGPITMAESRENLTVLLVDTGPSGATVLGELSEPLKPILADVKTEVAIRAAFKAIQDGKQVAVLAPTTLLATQHGNTFADRFAGYPIQVEVLSRFLTVKDAKRVIAGIATGQVDCIIGTHRLLQEGV